MVSRETSEGLGIVFAGAEPVSGPGERLRLYGVGPDHAQLIRAQLNDGRFSAHFDGQAIAATLKPATSLGGAACGCSNRVI